MSIQNRTMILSLSAVVWMFGSWAAGQVEAETNNEDPKWDVVRPEPDAETEEADNSYCLVCHSNYEGEQLASTHQPKGVGCETCHGVSDAHSSDEDNLTPPEIMWAKDRIVSRCMTCHSGERLVANEKAGVMHRKVLDSEAAAKEGRKTIRIGCVHCHGKHKLDHRTRVWDKETGELLESTGGPQMDPK